MSGLRNNAPDPDAALSAGLVGVGAWGQRVLHSSALVSNLAVRWLCDPKLEGATPPERRLARLEALLEDPACAALLVATPEETHGAIALRALDAGKFVFVEKPLCTRVGELEALLCHPRGPTHLMVGHLLAYDFAFLALAKYNACFAFSTIRSVRHSLPGARPSRSAWWTLAPHDVSVLLRLWGLPQEVQVVAADEGSVEATLKFAEGRLAHLSLSTRASSKRRTLLAHAHGYQLVIDDMRQPRVRLVHDQHERPVRIPASAPLERELRHFATCAQGGGGFLTGLLPGAQVVEVLLAGQSSLQAGKPCTLRARPTACDAAETSREL
jgi:UDP-2-acetamido-3-amino-2,3-dideoxy-glucuronate N-acetyltransferase